MPTVPSVRVTGISVTVLHRGFFSGALMGSGAWYTMMPAPRTQRQWKARGGARGQQQFVFDTWWHDACHVLHFLFCGAVRSGVLAWRALPSLVAHFVLLPLHASARLDDGV
jgi:hypothetical protein